MPSWLPADVTIAACTSDDVEEIAELYSGGSGRHADRARIARNTSLFPAFVARDAEGRMVAFVFTVDFAPDLLELANIFVVPEHQSKGLGTRLMDAAEEAATEAGFSWMMLVNSMLVPATYEKRAATDFYIRRGYSIILDSGPSKVFAKQL